ncbi:MAG: mechanosensitive ion channel [Promethearchaeota archaeon]|nr:MAG: mechanosensitive ion channel [Candidatus Lokiarchaeota archaeon]
MAIFASDLEALIYASIIGVSLYIGCRLLTYLLDKIKRIPMMRKNKILFAARIVSILVLFYFVIEGFPILQSIPSQYSVVITGAVSIALAFAASGIFSNLVAGILIWIVDPIDIGDVVKIKEHKGVVKSMTLNKVILETFDGVIVEITNSDVVSSLIQNYTTNLKYRKRFIRFKRQLRAPQDIGNAQVDIDLFDDEMRKKQEEDIRNIFTELSENQQDTFHAYTFKMQVPYEGFRVKVDKMRKLCEAYREKFGYPPNFHIFGYSYEIFLKFRIVCLDWQRLFKYQPQFAKDLYRIILE